MVITIKQDDESVSLCRYQKMRGSILSILACIQLSLGAPQGFLNGLSIFLTSLTGGGNTGEVDDYENAPYTVIQKYNVSLH